jgi:hypothetical protein
MATARQRRYERRPRRRSGGCFEKLLVVVWIVVIFIAVYLLLVRPLISTYIGGQILEQVAGTQQLDQVSQTIPDVVSALPLGQLVISEQQANEFAQSNSTLMQQIDALEVHFVPGQVQADLVVRGLRNQITFGLEARNGKVEVVDPRINGPLEALIAPEQLISGLTDRFNQELAAQGKLPASILIEQEQIVIMLTATP